MEEDKKFLEYLKREKGDRCSICQSKDRTLKCRETTINNIITICPDCLGFLSAILNSIEEAREKAKRRKRPQTVEELAKKFVDTFSELMIDKYYFRRGENGIRNHVLLDEKANKKFDYEQLIEEIQKEIAKRKISKGS